MHFSETPKKSFTLLSCVALIGGVLAFAPAAQAACPEPDPGALPYKNAPAPTSACSAADLAFFKTEANKANQTFSSLEASLTAKNAACGACIFTNEADAAWGPIVYIGTEGGALVNYGSCFEKAPGGSAVCGQAVEKFDLCAKSRCTVDTGYCADAAAQQTCIQTVANDPASCGKYDYQTDCPNYDAVEALCSDVFEVAAVLCGAPATVVDAGAGDGGGKDSGTTSSSSSSSGSTSSSSSSSSGTSGSSSSSSSGGKSPGSSSSGGKQSSSTSSGVTITEKPQPESDSGCTQTGSSNTSGSIASALVLAAAVGAAASRRRRNAK